MKIVGGPSTVVSESQGFNTEVAQDLGGCDLPSSNHQTRASENTASRLSENLKPETSNRDFLSRGLGAIAAVLLAVGGLFTARDLATSQPQQLVAAVEAPAKAETPRYLSKPIAEIQPIIDRVLADNPETDGQAPSDFGTVDAANWRLLKLVIPKPDGEWLKVTLARPATWLETQERDDSGRLWLEFEELDIANWADVLSVESCPEPAIGDGRLVTGKFEHSSADVIDLHVAAQTQPIGTTSNHPFWSEDRQDFVQAGDLQIGERLRLESGSLTTVTASVPREGQVPVFNLEVDGEHVYYVGDAGVLVHNNGDRYTLGGRLPGQRRVGSPIDPRRHNAIAAIKDGKGKIVDVIQSVSGRSFSDSFERLIRHGFGYPATHTEARLAARLRLNPGETMTILGQKPPCANCRSWMNAAANAYQAKYVYQWWEDGILNIWETR